VKLNFNGMSGDRTAAKTLGDLPRQQFVPQRFTVGQSSNQCTFPPISLLLAVSRPRAFPRQLRSNAQNPATGLYHRLTGDEELVNSLPRKWAWPGGSRAKGIVQIADYTGEPRLIGV
jgi:hypothetical protein